MSSFALHGYRFLNEQSKTMISSKPTCDCNWTNFYVGLSCFSYALPALIIALLGLDSRQCLLYEMAFYVLVSTNSFLSDYVFNGRVSFWHCLDRWTATICFVLSGLKVLLLSVTLLDFILIASFGVISLYCLNSARKSKAASIWQKYHIGWHIIGGLLMCYIVYLEHVNVNRLSHPALQLRDYLSF